MARIIRKTRELPVDTGYAWFVAVGAFINLFISLGTYRVYGVIFLEVLDYYDTSSALSSTMFGIFMLTCALALVVHTLVVDKLTERTMGICGGVSFGLSLILQVFSPNIYFFIIVFGVLGGFGSTYTMYTAIISLGIYFDKRLSLASGLAFTGSSVGQLVIPQLMEVIFNNYDLKGAMLILGGIQLHPLISAMLFRPRSFYEKKQTPMSKLETGQEDSVNEVHDPKGVEIVMPKENKTTESSTLNETVQPTVQPNIKSSLLSSDVKSDLNKPQLDETEVIVRTGSIRTVSCTSNNNDVKLEDFQNTRSSSFGDPGEDDVLENRSEESKSIEDISKSVHKTIAEINNRQSDTEDNLSEDCDPEVTQVIIENKLSEVFSLKQSIKILCTSPRFILFTCGRCFSILAMYLVILFLPPYAIDNGCTMTQVTFLLSIVGFCDLPSRPLHGWIVSFKVIDATYYVGITTLVASVVIFICIFMPSYTSVFVMGIGQGVFYNPVLCLMNVIIIDSVGTALFPRAMMFTMITMYGCMTFLPSVFGILYDTLGSYRIPMCIAAGCGVFGGFLTIVERKTR